MLISYPCLTVTCYYPYFFVVWLFSFACKNVIRGYGKKPFENERFLWPNSNGTHWPGVFIVRLCGDCYLPCETRKLFSRWVTVRVCERERDTQSAFPLNEISWLRLIRSGYATCSELNYIVPGDVTLETTTIPGTCYTYWHGELMISNFWSDMIKRFFSSVFVLFFSSFCRYSFFLLKGRLDKRAFENVSRNHANTHLTRHLQVTFWSKIQDKYCILRAELRGLEL